MAVDEKHFQILGEVCVVYNLMLVELAYRSAYLFCDALYLLVSYLVYVNMIQIP